MTRLRLLRWDAPVGSLDLHRHPVALVPKRGQLGVRCERTALWPASAKDMGMADSCLKPRSDRPWDGCAGVANGAELADVPTEDEADTELLEERYGRPDVLELPSFDIIHDDERVSAGANNTTNAWDRDGSVAEDYVEGCGLGRFWPIEHYLVYCVVGETEDVIVAELDAEFFTESRSLMGKSAYLFLGKVIDVG